MGVIQFKRILNGHTKGYTYNDIMDKIMHLDLSEGEPILCSYLHEGLTKYLFAINTGDSIQSYPMFNSLEEYQEFLRNLAVDFRAIDELTRKDAHSHEAKTLLPIAFKKLEKIFWTLWI